MNLNFLIALIPKSTYLFVGVILFVLLPDNAKSQEIDTTQKGLDYIGHGKFSLFIGYRFGKK